MNKEALGLASGASFIEMNEMRNRITANASFRPAQQCVTHAMTRETPTSN